jgi:V/A-type H+/Na+-transporting ATPase subunit A
MRLTIMELLQKEQRLQQVVKLVGPDVLPVTQRLVLEVCNLFKNGFLQQVSYDKVDTFSSARKQFLMLKTIITFYRKADGLVKKGIGIAELRELPVYEQISRMKQKFAESDMDKLEELPQQVSDALAEIDI